jgi:dienelactone hydrolase
VRARGKGAFDALTARPEVDKTKMAAIGYCFGGTMALELALSGAPLAAAVGFHSGINSLSMADAKNVKGRLLICLGADDPWVPPEQRQKLEQDLKGTGVNWQLNLYGGQVHSFTNPKADARGDLKTSRYDAYTDQDSWHAMLRLFKAVFGS